MTGPQDHVRRGLVCGIGRRTSLQVYRMGEGEGLVLKRLIDLII